MSSDTGTAALSAAEEMAFGGTDLDTTLDRRAVERAIDGVATGPWWRSCGPTVTVSPSRRGTRSSSARDRCRQVEIRLSDEQLTLATAAHELAHALAGADRGHDGVFRAAYVDVIAVLAGTTRAADLTAAFDELGLEASKRRWPTPYWAVGDGFAVTSSGAAVVPPTLTANPTRRSR